MKIARGQRGRPPKFGRPARVVALTLPDERVARRRPATHPERTVAELVRIADRRSLIVVNRAEFTRLPGVTMVPVSSTRAFLALEPGFGMSELELAVSDRLEEDTV